MTGILKDFPFAIAYLDDIIIFSKTPQDHLSHICMVFKKLKSANLSMKKSKCSFFSKGIQYLGHILSVQAYDHYLLKLTPYNICDHQQHLNKLDLSLD